MYQKYVSVHGGHSGQFCLHAKNRLEDIIKRYIELEFTWVGITEHSPPVTDQLRYPDEAEAGISANFLFKQFENYMSECRRLQKKYASKIKIFTGIETETYSGYKNFIKDVVRRFRPDYIVGSVHHVDDMCMDFSRELYEKAAKAVGGYDAMYCRYFDEQYEMIKALDPAVIGHFDLVRLFDPDYKKRIRKKKIWQRILRNLELIKDRELIMDFNLRALYKGANEPYITEDILRKAKELEIAVVPGDDSHGIDQVGINMERGLKILHQHGFDAPWPTPRLYLWD
ncbi:MAG: histidinol-phosphatase [Thermodesulfobacteriota bacterium]|nr:histidinol-phosphatase [Thermodesulfobacteriota bacterium]